MNRTQGAAWTSKQIALIGAIAVLALVIRLYYVHTAVVDHPMRGDAIQYVVYAVNLFDYRVFSLQMSDALPVPDSFRDPGYPTFLAMLIASNGRGQSFYLATLNVQCILSALTVLIYALLARRWLGMVAALTVGLGLAFWPHAITLSGYLLSETLLAFLFALALWLLQIATDNGSTRVGALSGLLFGAAALTNATLLPLIPLVACAGSWRQRIHRKLWLTVLICTMLPCLAWAARNIHVNSESTSSDRALVNLIQGSWPEFHSAWYSALKNEDPASLMIMATIDAEYRLTREDRMAGIRVVAARMLSSPGRYIAWYLSKPCALWGWTIDVGIGDIYVFPTVNSPLSGRGPLSYTTDVLFLINPLLMLLAALGVILVLLRGFNQDPAIFLAAACVVLITAIYAALQSDARYASPYRGIEWIMASVGAFACKDFLRGWINSRNTMHRHQD